MAARLPGVLKSIAINCTTWHIKLFWCARMTQQTQKSNFRVQFRIRTFRLLAFPLVSHKLELRGKGNE